MAKERKIEAPRAAGRPPGPSQATLERERVARRAFALKQIEEYEKLPRVTRRILEHPEYRPITESARQVAQQPIGVQELAARALYGLSRKDMAKVARLKEFQAVFLVVYRSVVELGMERRAVGDYSLMGFYGCSRADSRSWAPVFSVRCGAKTRGGSPCKRDSVKGRSRCRFHGGYTPPKVRAVDGLGAEMLARLQSDPLDLAALIALGFVGEAEKNPTPAPWEIEKRKTDASKRRYLARKAAGIPPAQPLASRSMRGFFLFSTLTRARL